MGKHTHPDIWEELIGRLKEGERQTDLADEYGISPSTISKHLERAGLSIPRAHGRSHMPPKSWADKVELASGGFVHLVCSLDLRMASEADRAFVFQLLDELREYREAHG